MKYLENAFRFTFKNFLISLPLLISMVIPAIVMSIGSVSLFTNMSNMESVIQDFINGNSSIPDLILGMYGRTFIISMLVGGLISIFISIIVYPATYGMINKKYETGKATLGDFTQCMSKYIGRYVQFILLNFAIGIGVYLVLVILIGIAAVIISLVNAVVGILLMVLFILAFCVGSFALMIYMSLWFPAVCIENTGIIQGLKNSFKQVKGSFWPILGITLLISLCAGVGGGILSLFPIVGTVMSSIVSTLAGYITIVYYFEIYRAKTGRFATPENMEQLDGGVQ